jgi:type IV secretion system protein TrbG
MELRSTEKTYMASVSRVYAEDQIIALCRQNAAARGRPSAVAAADRGKAALP